MHTRGKKKTNRKKKKGPLWQLHLYVAGTTARSVLASGNLHRLCEQYLKGNYRVTIIDIVNDPDLAREQEILATPTLVRVVPGPQKTVIGCLSDTERVLKALQIDDPRDHLIPLVASVPIGHA